MLYTDPIILITASIPLWPLIFFMVIDRAFYGYEVLRQLSIWLSALAIFSFLAPPFDDFNTQTYTKCLAIAFVINLFFSERARYKPVSRAFVIASVIMPSIIALFSLLSLSFPQYNAKNISETYQNSYLHKSLIAPASHIIAENFVEWGLFVPPEDANISTPPSNAPADIKPNKTLPPIKPVGHETSKKGDLK